MTHRENCTVCDHEQSVGDDLDDWKCDECGSYHFYDNDCYRVALSEEQKRILLWFARGAVVWVNVSEGECSPEGVFSSEELADKAKEWKQVSVEYVLDNPQ